MRIFHSTLAFLLVTQVAFSQSKLQTAQVEQTEGNLMSGQVKFEKRIKTPPSFIFVGPDGAEKTLTPDNTRTVTIFLSDESREIYSSHTVDIDFSSLDLKKLDSKPEPDRVTQTIFARHLVTGKIHLYGFIDANEKRHYFISKNGSAPRELTYRKYYYREDGPDLPVTNLTTSTGVNQVKVNMAYKNELYNLMNDNPSLRQQDFEKLEFKENDLVNLVVRYNGESDYVRPLEKANIAGELKAGISIITLNVNNQGEMSTKVSPNFGVGLNITLPRSQWSIQNDLRYVTYSSERRLDFTAQNYEIYTFNLSYIRLQSMFRYSQKLGNRLDGYIQGGFLNGYLMKDEVYTKRYFYSSESIHYPAGTPKKFERGLIIGAGVGFGKVYAGLDYEISNGYRNSIFKPTFKTLYTTVSYRF